MDCSMSTITSVHSDSSGPTHSFDWQINFWRTYPLNGSIIRGSNAATLWNWLEGTLQRRASLTLSRIRLGRILKSSNEDLAAELSSRRSSVEEACENRFCIAPAALRVFLSYARRRPDCSTRALLSLIMSLLSRKRVCRAQALSSLSIPVANNEMIEFG